MIRLMRRIFSKQDGATAIEYGLIAALVVIAMLGALSAMSSTTVGIWNTVSHNVIHAGK